MLKACALNSRPVIVRTVSVSHFGRSFRSLTCARNTRAGIES